MEYSHVSSDSLILATVRNQQPPCAVAGVKYESVAWTLAVEMVLIPEWTVVCCLNELHRSFF